MQGSFNLVQMVGLLIGKISPLRVPHSQDNKIAAYRETWKTSILQRVRNMRENF